MREFKTILFATDFSDCSTVAFDYAYSLAQKCESKLVLVHVVSEPVDLRGFYVPHVSFDLLEQEIEDGANKMMSEFCQKHFSDGDNYEVLVVPGLAHTEIIKQAELHSFWVHMVELDWIMFYLVVQQRRLCVNRPSQL